MGVRKLAVAATCVATVLAPFVSTAAGNAANPDAIELVPVPWPVKYKYGSAAWGTCIPPRTPMYDIAFGNALRLVGHDMKVTDYRDTGHLNLQVPPAWWIDN